MTGIPIRTGLLRSAAVTGASGGEFVNCLAFNDYIKFAYNADVAGTYEVTMTYRSGSAANEIKWYSDPEGNIAEGTQAVENPNNETDTVTFNMTVTEAGAGTLILTAPDDGKGPQIDKFDIKLIEKSGETPETYTITASAGEGGTIDPSGRGYSECRGDSDIYDHGR